MDDKTDEREIEYDILQNTINLQGEGIEIRHWFDDKLTKEEWKKLNRLIEIELTIERINK